MIDLVGLSTEGRNPETMDLDTMSSLEIVEVMNREDARAVASVTGMLPRVAQAADWAIEAISSGGRLIYVGAGTSGRLGVLDAVECPPTFGVSPDVVVGLIAGGEDAFVKAVEGAEDDMALCIDDLKEIDLKPRDVVIGLAASGRTPYVIGGLRYAHELGCKTVAIACNRDSRIGREADLAIEPVPGPEVLTGSTRLKAGTVQKLILNMISTATMVGIGKAYENLMVDVQQTNEKLRARAQNIVMEATGCTREGAVAALADAGGRVKTAVVMVLAGLDAREAESALEDSHGHVRGAVADEVAYVSARAADAGTMRAVWRFLNERMLEIRYVPYESYDCFEEQVLSNPEFDPKGFKIALEKGEVVGVCGVLSCSDLLPTETREGMPSYLYLLAVDPHHRRRGIGSELLAQAEAYALEQGNWGLRVSHKCPIKFAWELSVHDAQHNKAPGVLADTEGESFLAKRGFTVEATEVSYYIDLASYELTQGMLEERGRLQEMGYTIGYFDPARHGGQDEMFDRLGDESYRKKFRTALLEGSDILVALHDDRTVCGIAGALSVEGTGRGFFQGLAVDPAHGGKKLGNVLFFTLCEELKRKGARYMTFFVDDDNYARKIYDRAGGVVADSWKIMAKKGGSDHE